MKKAADRRKIKLKEAAKLLDMEPETLRNKIRDGSLGIQPIRDGAARQGSPIWFYYDEVIAASK